MQGQLRGEEEQQQGSAAKGERRCSYKGRGGGAVVHLVSSLSAEDEAGRDWLAAVTAGCRQPPPPRSLSVSLSLSLSFHGALEICRQLVQAIHNIIFHFLQDIIKLSALRFAHSVCRRCQHLLKSRADFIAPCQARSSAMERQSTIPIPDLPPSHSPSHSLFPSVSLSRTA